MDLNHNDIDRFIMFIFVCVFISTSFESISAFLCLSRPFTSKSLHKILRILVLTKSAGPTWYHGIYHRVNAPLGVDYACVLDVQFGCAANRLMQ
jgi:hypothetical protein